MKPFVENKAWRNKTPTSNRSTALPSMYLKEFRRGGSPGEFAPIGGGVWVSIFMRLPSAAMGRSVSLRTLLTQVGLGPLENFIRVGKAHFCWLPPLDENSRKPVNADTIRILTNKNNCTNPARNERGASGQWHQSAVGILPAVAGALFGASWVRSPQEV